MKWDLLKKSVIVFYSLMVELLQKKELQKKYLNK